MIEEIKKIIKYEILTAIGCLFGIIIFGVILATIKILIDLIPE